MVAATLFCSACSTVATVQDRAAPAAPAAPVASTAPDAGDVARGAVGTAEKSGAPHTEFTVPAPASGGQALPPAQAIGADWLPLVCGALVEIRAGYPPKWLQGFDGSDNWFSPSAQSQAGFFVHDVDIGGGIEFERDQVVRDIEDSRERLQQHIILGYGTLNVGDVPGRYEIMYEFGKQHGDDGSTNRMLIRWAGYWSRPHKRDDVDYVQIGQVEFTAFFDPGFYDQYAPYAVAILKTLEIHPAVDRESTPAPKP
ncbi:MAG: hypothetical protein P4L83_00295 [Nevskia sp.]|nr:hypothetical protein [Nevskia sp.]